MGKGRPAKLDAIKRLQGTDQPCRMRGMIEAKQISEINEIVDLKNFTVLKSKRAKEIFIQKANQLISLKLLTDMDIENLVIYASSLDLLFDCIKEMKKGMYKELFDDYGKVKGYLPNPYIKNYREMIEITNRIGGEFGFTPMSRMKLKSEKPVEKDPFQILMDKLNS